MLISVCPGAETVIEPGEPARSPGPVTENELSFAPEVGLAEMPSVAFKLKRSVVRPLTLTDCAGADAFANVRLVGDTCMCVTSLFILLRTNF
jgi:hypothetical protein